jgi:hypothetical protein
MQDMYVGERYQASNSANCWEYLFVYSMFEAEFCPVAKHFDMINYGDLAWFIRQTVNLHDITETVISVSTVNQLPQLLPLLLVNDVVRVHPEDPFPGAGSTETLRAAEKSSHQGKSNILAPNRRQISGVRSLDPVSTMMISSTHG